MAPHPEYEKNRWIYLSFSDPGPDDTAMTAVVRGRIDFNGQNLVELSEKQLRHIRGADISMVFQEPMTSLNPVKKIGDHMIEVIRLHKKQSKRV